MSAEAQSSGASREAAGVPCPGMNVRRNELHGGPVLVVMPGHTLGRLSQSCSLVRGGEVSHPRAGICDLDLGVDDPGGSEIGVALSIERNPGDGMPLSRQMR